MLHMIKRQAIVLRKLRGRFEGLMSHGLSPAGTLTMSEPMGVSLFAAVLGMALLVFALVIALALMSPESFHVSAIGTGLGAKMAIAGVTGRAKSGTEERKPANIRSMEADLKTIAKELEAAQEEMAQGPVSQERGEEIEAKAEEMVELQTQLDRYNKIAGINKGARSVGKVTMPGEDEDGLDRKRLYTTPGHFFAASAALKHYKDVGMQGWSAKVEIGRRIGKKMLLRGEQAREFERKAYDPASLPVLGEDAIIPIDRDNELVRFQEPEILSIRDMLNVTTTTSDAIRYVKHIATTRAAATVARGGLKPYLKIEFEPATVNVETIAVLSKVTEQDVSDAPRLVSYIDGEMQLDVRVEEERQITWGSGVNELLGLFAAANAIPEFNRAEAGDTIIDIIRKMRTDRRKARVTPNFVAIDPIDWEEVELTKGTDTHYIWGLITDLRGPRIWSLRVVESDAMTNPETGERRILLGDGVRGATLYDREQVQLAVGFVDDDFARNLRTLRAEERLALAVKRNFAFEYAQTNEPES